MSEKSGRSGESGSAGSVFMSLYVYRFQFSAWTRLLKADRLPTSRALLFARKNQFVEIQFQLRPALLRLSATLSQYARL